MISNIFGWMKTGIKLLIVIGIIVVVYTLLTTYHFSDNLLGFFSKHYDHNEKNVEVTSFDPLKAKKFYDAILTEQTLNNLKDLPKINNISCMGDECNISFSYRTENGTFNETVTMMDDNVLNFTSPYISSDPKHTIYTGKGNISEINKSYEPKVKGFTLNFTVESDVNCGFKEERPIYSLYPNGHVYVIIPGSSFTPKDCVTHKTYLITIPLPKGYNVTKIHITFPNGLMKTN